MMDKVISTSDNIMDTQETVSIYRDDLIRAAMAAQNLSDEQVAELAGLSRHTVRFIRTGRKDVRITSLKAVADALGLDMSDLFKRRAA
jgi:transcriptional regulator with XRE-family HTH domain